MVISFLDTTGKQENEGTQLIKEMSSLDADLSLLSLFKPTLKVAVDALEQVFAF